jgi:hypothetical protein
VIPLVCAIPKSSRHDTHHRIARFAAAISSHPKRSANRAAPSLIETRNQLRNTQSARHAFNWQDQSVQRELSFADKLAKLGSLENENVF